MRKKKYKKIVGCVARVPYSLLQHAKPVLNKSARPLYMTPAKPNNFLLMLLNKMSAMPFEDFCLYCHRVFSLSFLHVLSPIGHIVTQTSTGDISNCWPVTRRWKSILSTPYSITCHLFFSFSIHRVAGNNSSFVQPFFIIAGMRFIDYTPWSHNHIVQLPVNTICRSIVYIGGGGAVGGHPIFSNGFRRSAVIDEPNEGRVTMTD